MGINILAVGDVFGKPGREILQAKLPGLQEKFKIDFTVVNVENATNGRGLNIKTFKELKQLDIDAYTLGNHTFGQDEIFDLLASEKTIIRPANGHPHWPGLGVRFFSCKQKTIAVMNLLGTVLLDGHINPFLFFDQWYEENKETYDILIVDFHAELTSEKIAFGYHVQKRAHVMFGTHTHVQTADARILDRTCAYITDIGMTGPLDGVIGVKKEIILQRFLKGYPGRFQVADGVKQLNAIVVSLDDAGTPKNIETIHEELI